MLNRFFGLLYFVSAGWLGLVWYFFNRIEPSAGAQFFMVAVVGGPPLAILLAIDFVFARKS